MPQNRPREAVGEHERHSREHRPKELNGRQDEWADCRAEKSHHQGWMKVWDRRGGKWRDGWCQSGFWSITSMVTA